MEKITIYIKERKLYIYTLVSLGIVALSANMLLSTQSPAFNMNVTLVKIASLITLAFFAMIFFVCMKMLIKGREGFLAGPKGIYDNSSVLSFGFIAWDDIDFIRVKKSEKILYLIIGLKDIEKFKEDLTLSKIIEINMKLCNYPVAINSQNLRCNIYELEKTLKNMYEDFLHIKSSEFKS